MIKCLPNLISVLRLVLAPIFYFLINRSYYIFSLFILISGALSDFLDGYYARKYKLESSLGIVLDPLADKIFTNVVLWGLYLNFHITGIFILACLSILRDLLVVSGSIWILIKSKNVQNVIPIFLGKVYTAFIFLFCVLTLLNPKNTFLINIGSLICVVLLLISGIIYTVRFYKNK